MPTIWLASYPKSGNTWFRILVANLWSNADAPIDINLIDSADSIASWRNRFDQAMLIESGLLTLEEVDRMRPALYRYNAASRAASDQYLPSIPVRLVKTHDAWTLTDRGEPLLGGARGAAGAILFVRDPRDVAGSFANHMDCTIDQSIERMGDPDFCFASSPDRITYQLRQRLLGWSGFAASWLDQQDVPVHLVRYEDMVSAPFDTAAAALSFAGIDAPRERLERAVQFSDIGELQRQEAEKGFREAPRRTASFFRRGMAGGWRDDLTAEQIARIERDHGTMMDRLLYARITQPTETRQ